MKYLYQSLLLLCFINSIAQNDSIKHFNYNPDAGLQYKNNHDLAHANTDEFFARREYIA
jgi:hypothetical protein